MDAEVTEHYGRLYRDYHIAYPKVLGGRMTKGKVEIVKQLVAGLPAATLLSGVPRLLDYGSGKGYQYLAHRVHEQWGGSMPICYDPGVRQLAERPEGKFDGIICCDVLEHIEERHLPDILTDVFGYVTPTGRPFVFLHTCCRPARKHFDDGTNLHMTVKDPAWWEELIANFKPAHVRLVATYEEAEDAAG
jgi:hypothetical protein